MRSYNYLANELPRELVEQYNDIQNELLKIIVRKLKDGESPNSVLRLIQDKVSSYDPKIQKIVAIMFADMKKKAVKDGAKEIEENEPVQNNEANSLIEPKLIGAMAIVSLLNTRLINSAYNEYLNDYNYVNSGLVGKEEKFNTIVGKLANKGIKIADGGKQKSLESLIRGNVMFEITQANNEVNMENFQKSGAKFVEVSSHPTARTWNKYMKHSYEDHSSWQGQVYYSGEAVDGYEEFESTCGYGEMLGIGGINCYHQFQMNYDGKGTQTEYGIARIRKDYANSQEQRNYERAIRNLKQARAVYEEAGNEKLATQITKNITNATNQLKKFCERNNLNYQAWRTRI